MQITKAPRILVTLTALAGLIGVAPADGPEYCNSSSQQVAMPTAGASINPVCDEERSASAEAAGAVTQAYAAIQVAHLDCPGCPGEGVGCARIVRFSVPNATVEAIPLGPTSQCPNGAFVTGVNFGEDAYAWIECGICVFPL